MNQLNEHLYRGNLLDIVNVDDFDYYNIFLQ